VEEKLGAVGPFRTLVTVLRDATPAVHFRVEGDAFQFEFVTLVWSARFVRKDQAIRVRFLRGLVFLEFPDQRRGHRNFSLFFVLRLEPEERLSGDPEYLRAE